MGGNPDFIAEIYRGLVYKALRMSHPTSRDAGEINVMK